VVLADVQYSAPPSILIELEPSAFDSGPALKASPDNRKSLGDTCRVSPPSRAYRSDRAPTRKLDLFPEAGIQS
jgi:hypothetical protein